MNLYHELHQLKNLPLLQDHHPSFRLPLDTGFYLLPRMSSLTPIKRTLSGTSLSHIPLLLLARNILAIRLSFREVCWQKNHSTEIPSPLLASRFATASNSTSQLLEGAPPSAWAKPDVAVSMQAADGEVAAVPKENAEKLLQDLEGACSETSRPPSVTASE